MCTAPAGSLLARRYAAAMMGAPSPAGADEVELVRHEYESSLSWRLTRPLRALRRHTRSVSQPALRGAGSEGANHDSWLEHFWGERLDRIDAACERGGPERFALFRDLDVDLWALLLSQEYESYPNIRALLPGMPEPALQQLWVGSSGLRLANQSKSFYEKLSQRFGRYAEVPLEQARVLDFGCGWGRLTRYLARDVEPGRLYGCDPVPAILDVCRQSRVPANLARTDFVPERLPFEERFDLAFSFSVFTHLSEAAHEACLGALHAALNPGAILALTVRPPDFLALSELMHPLLSSLGSDLGAWLEEPRYLFVPHAAGPENMLYDGGEPTYGESVVTLAYIEQRWSSMFELLDVAPLIGDLHQVMLTLRRR